MFSDKQVEYFKALINNCSYAQTAEFFGVSRQTVQQTISGLEEQLGVKLFASERGKLHIQKTADILCKFLDEYAENEKNLYEALKKAQREENSILRLDIEGSLVIDDIIVQALKKFQKYHPECKVEINYHTPNSIVKRLGYRLSDMAVIAGCMVPEDNKIIRSHLRQVQLCLFETAVEELKNKHMGELDIHNKPLITFQSEGESDDEYKERVERQKAKFNIDPVKVINVASFDTLYMKLRMGEGIVTGTTYSHYRTSKYVTCYETGMYDEIICCLRQNETNKSVRDMAELLKKEFEGKQ